jgi:hypothetical protein
VACGIGVMVWRGRIAMERAIPRQSSAILTAGAPGLSGARHEGRARCVIQRYCEIPTSPTSLGQCFSFNFFNSLRLGRNCCRYMS